MDQYTSLKLSKLLAENGCELESEVIHMVFNNTAATCSKEGCGCYQGKYHTIRFQYTIDADELEEWEEKGHIEIVQTLPAYDILNDICVKYAKQFFGEGFDTPNKTAGDLEEACKRTVCEVVLYLLQQNKKQEAEDYIWENCLFNCNK